ncbi:precorrin-6A/cobalt-precorrin-6A reductase, partial [Mycobacterium sp.]|uniref:precorrin-6A/cobalt-precorrin-6A reductase n=1 Tax=Mycobacterium sp. TaxID=1785 RepID=UPI002B86617B
MMRVLLLGGTSEARALAKSLHPLVDIVSSLAGRVPDPALPVGPVRIGGFGGVDGLKRWL